MEIKSYCHSLSKEISKQLSNMNYINEFYEYKYIITFKQSRIAGK